MSPYWSWVLTAVGVFGLYLAGKHDREFPLVVRGEGYDTYKLWVYRRAVRSLPDTRVSAVRPLP